MAAVDYVRFGGDLIFRQPYLATDVTFYGFVLPADLASLQALCDSRFNRPSGGAVQIEPAGPMIIVAFTSLKRLSSVDAPDSREGWFNEQECAIWTLVVNRREERQYWFQPYLFVDNCYAMACGREVYGFPKTIGELEIPDDPSTAEHFSVRTLGIEKFGPDSQGKLIDLIQVRRTSAGSGVFRSIGTAIEFLRELTGTLASQSGLLGGVELAAHTLDDLIHRRAPLIFLKQFPDAVTPGKACYQAIVKSSSEMTSFEGGGFLDGQYEIAIAPCDSHPIVKELGLAGPVVVPAAAFQVRFDFTLDNGTEIWRA